MGNIGEKFVQAFKCDRVLDFNQILQHYAVYLLQTSNSYRFPIDLDNIIDFFDIRITEKALPTAKGFLLGDKNIYVEESNPSQVKKFTIAHELVEILIASIIDEDPDWVREEDLITLIDNGGVKANYCEWGAACILMPTSLFTQELNTYGVSLNTALQLSQINHVSLIATIRRIQSCIDQPSAIIVWKETNKPSELPRPNQYVLDGFWELPLKKLRVDNVYTSESFQLYIPQHKSLPNDSRINDVLTNSRDQITTTYECLNLSHNDNNTYKIESMRYLGDDTVISFLVDI